jgi:hypothetical protein
MEKYLLNIFQMEINRQCKFSIIAIEQIEEGLANNDSDLIWYSIQNLLVAVANISKIFWPPKNPEKRKKLRESLNIQDNSPLKSRDFRNSFEHFDERLERWAKSSKRHNFIDSNLGSSNMIKGIDQEDYLRNFNPENWVLTFRGDKYELEPIKNAINELYTEVKKNN